MGATADTVRQMLSTARRNAFTYPSPPIASLAAAATAANSLQFDTDALFVWTKTSYHVDIAGAAITDSAYGVTGELSRCPACGFVQCSELTDVLGYYETLQDGEILCAFAGKEAVLTNLADINAIAFNAAAETADQLVDLRWIFAA